MNRYAAAVAITLFLLPALAGAASEQPAAPADAPKPDYRNRPDPCEVKQQKQPAPTKGAAPPAGRKPADKSKR